MTDYFNFIYEETHHDLLRFVVSKCNDLSYVEDIIQNVYMKVYKIINKKGNNYINNNKTFIIKLAKRELYKYYLFKSKKKDITTYNDDDVDQYIDDKDLLIDDQVLKSITIEKIWEEIKKEDITNQKIMVLYFLEDATIKEISHLLEINESTIKSRLYRTISRLKEKLGGNYE